MSDIEATLRSKIEAFVGEVSALIREGALHQVLTAFGHREKPAAKPAGRRGPKAAAAAPAAAAAAPAAAPAAKKRPAAAKSAEKRGKGEKRSPDALVALVEAVANEVKKTAGQNVTELANALSTTTKDLALPIRKLVAEGRLKTKGERRATRYFPGK